MSSQLQDDRPVPAEPQSGSIITKNGIHEDGMDQHAKEWVIDLAHAGMQDVEVVGGKNASLGEMIQHLAPLGVQVPQGYATTAYAFRTFLEHNSLTTRIQHVLDALDIEDLAALEQTGLEVRSWVAQASLPEALEQAIRNAHQRLETESGGNLSCAVRSSATAEDLPDASFAGQQETYLNVRGIDAVLDRIRHVFASLYNDRAIAYRVHQGFDHHSVALSAGIQQMVRSDLGASGVIFTLDTESGFRDAVLITGAWGLGETIVQGQVNPDEFLVYKPSVANNKRALLRKTLGSKKLRMVYRDNRDGGSPVEIIETTKAEQQRFCVDETEATHLAEMAIAIEQHYQKPMDIEWAKDGNTGALYIVQARPETVRSRESTLCIEEYKLEEEEGSVLVEGRAIGGRIGQGPVRVIPNVREMQRVQAGDVLVTDMTDPDWEPVMKKASAIVTNRGGRTCHAAIIARELGIPAIVGCGDATERLEDDQVVTVSCAEGETGRVYAGKLAFQHIETDIGDLPEPKVQIMMNVGNPERAFDFARLPHRGIGLARLEFIISNSIGIHPRALLEPNEISAEVQSAIDERTRGYATPAEFFVEKLREGIGSLAAAFAPHPVIVRLSDFKSNEYAHLIGGKHFEPTEENPMLGFRGASRYLSKDFAGSFALECQAIKAVREDMGLDNVQVMVPFVRTLDEAREVVALLEHNGLRRSEGVKIIMMCEIPANVLLAEQFLEHFDGFSIGSNDLTQLTLGVDRDSGLVAHRFDERDPAVMKLLAEAISACKKAGKYVGICGQAPSDHPELAEWLMQQGIDSLSLNPDSVLPTWLRLSTP